MRIIRGTLEGPGPGQAGGTWGNGRAKPGGQKVAEPGMVAPGPGYTVTRYESMAQSGAPIVRWNAAFAASFTMSARRLASS